MARRGCEKCRPPPQDLTKSPDRGRITWLDSLKGFAILCVVLGHVVDGFMTAGLFPGEASIQFGIYRFLYSFHMPLFFMISGFAFSTAYVSADGALRWDKLRWQILNLVSVYVLWMALLVTFKVVFASSVNSEVSFSALLWMWRDPYGPYWYLYVLVAYYAVAAFVSRFRPSLVLAGAVALSCAGMFFDFGSHFCLWRFAFFAPFFVVGSCLRRSWRGPGWGVAAVALLVWVGVLLFAPCDEVLDDARFAVAALSAGLFLWRLFSSARWADNALFRLCGTYSLQIYVAHCFFTAGFRVLFSAVGIDNFYVCAVSNFLLSASLPIALAVCLKRLGLHDAVFRPVCFARS